MKNTELELASEKPLPVTRLGLTIEEAFHAVTTGKLDEKQLAVMKDLLAMDAEQRFTRAFVAMQSELKAVVPTKPVPNNDGTIRYKYAPYEEIMKQVGPLLEKHKFTVSYSTDYAENRIITTIELAHEAGHKKFSKYAVRISAPPKSTDTQADGSTITYSKRGALCNILNITVDHDDDAGAGNEDAISEEQAQELQRRVKLTNSLEIPFLKFAGVTPSPQPTIEDYRKIAKSRYEPCDQMLSVKERKGR